MGNNYIAAILKTKRKEANLSVKAVLDQLRGFGVDISDKTLYGWERGHRQPDADTFLVLCRIYGIETLTGIQKTTPISKKASSFSDEAIEIASNYDALDSWGKQAVRAVIGVELSRLSDSHMLPIAGRDGSLRQGQLTNGQIIDAKSAIDALPDAPVDL